MTLTYDLWWVRYRVGLSVCQVWQFYFQPFWFYRALRQTKSQTESQRWINAVLTWLPSAWVTNFGLWLEIDVHSVDFVISLLSGIHGIVYCCRTMPLALVRANIGISSYFALDRITLHLFQFSAWWRLKNIMGLLYTFHPHRSQVSWCSVM